eukprot:TRINITY_DN377_c1_g1_i6.p1 TRINITY_DN377_c1_g1~~TRINITY_DN377_c1_g1_i6.p1  ORF type:complete len:523 (-),score=94.68 TRINITY_DN377_c1_g1_i6:346-1878(-)
MSSTTAVQYESTELMHKVELKISCQDLPSMDYMSKSDPMVVVFIKEGDSYVELGRTESVTDDNNPQFTTPIVMDYYFETVQNLKFAVYDVDSASAKLDSHDFVGQALASLGEIVGHKHSKKAFTLTNPSKGDGAMGTIKIVVEELGQLNANIKFSVAASNLDKKDFFGKSDPYIVISKAREDGEWMPVHKTETVMKNLNPTFAPFVVPLQSLCNGDVNRPLKFECFDWDRSGDHDFIGEFTTDVEQLTNGDKTVFEFKDPAKKKKKNYKNSGTLTFSAVEVITVASFLDYIKAGLEISLMVAIDFTASNGDRLYSGSLHYQNPYQPNDYQKAIVAVGELVANYDSDKLFPVYGFGAKYRNPKDPKAAPAVSHCFPANLNDEDPNCNGVQGILDAYAYIITIIPIPSHHSLTSLPPSLPPSSLVTTLLSTTSHSLVPQTSPPSCRKPLMLQKANQTSTTSFSSSPMVSSPIVTRPSTKSSKPPHCQSPSSSSALAQLPSLTWTFWTATTKV